VLIPLSGLKPSPFNPKRPLTAKQLSALRKNIDTFDFKRSLCVCRDFISGDGFFVLDGNTALDILNEMSITEVDCHIVDKVTDEHTLHQFMAGYSINKQPIYSDFADALGEADFTQFTGLDFDRYSLDKTLGNYDYTGLEAETKAAEEPAPAEAPAHETKDDIERQTQYFLILPPDCVDRLKSFVKTKAYKANKTEALAAKIDAMDETQFLENILQIVL
jgi:hypothetical protein